MGGTTPTRMLIEDMSKEDNCHLKKRIPGYARHLRGKFGTFVRAQVRGKEKNREITLTPPSLFLKAPSPLFLSLSFYPSLFSLVLGLHSAPPRRGTRRASTTSPGPAPDSVNPHAGPAPAPPPPPVEPGERRKERGVRGRERPWGDGGGEKEGGGVTREEGAEGRER